MEDSKSKKKHFCSFSHWRSNFFRARRSVSVGSNLERIFQTRATYRTFVSQFPIENSVKTTCLQNTVQTYCIFILWNWFHEIFVKWYRNFIISSTHSDSFTNLLSNAKILREIVWTTCLRWMILGLYINVTEIVDLNKS